MTFVLPAFGMGVVSSPTVPPAAFNITTRDTEANIISTTPTNPAGEVNVAFGTDTFDLYIYDGSVWNIYNND